MKCAFLLSSIVAAAALVHEETQYKNAYAAWKSEYGMDFEGEEEAQRFQIWAANEDTIAQHNTEGHDWTMGHNAFSALSWEEFRVRMGLGNVITPKLRRGDDAEVDVSSAPASVDWTTKGAVTDVKDQGQCGSCWAFSTTGSTEGQLFLNTGTLMSLSEQMLVECDHVDAGCQGGLMDNAFNWIGSNGGLCAESAYPYTSGGGSSGSCKAGCTKVVTVGGHKDVQSSSESALMVAVANQPVSVAIEADQSGFQFYSGGVFSGTCGTQLDHGVLTVGYGTDAGADYWKVKNSWGASWGDAGYIRMARNISSSAGQCGIAMQASYPTGVSMVSEVVEQ